MTESFPRPKGPRLADLGVAPPRQRPAPPAIVWERTMQEKLSLVIAAVAALEAKVAALEAELHEVRDA